MSSQNNYNKYFGDERIGEYTFKSKNKSSSCIYCGEVAKTREHLPTKAFFETIEGIDFAILPACVKCNNGFSKHEEYIASYLEILKTKVYNLHVLRNSIREKLKKKPALKTRIENQIRVMEDKIEMIFDKESFDIVLLKIARGHMAYELNEIFLSKPDFFTYKFIFELSESELNNFNGIEISNKSPEIGCRKFEFPLITCDGEWIYNWEEIGKGEYKYLVFHKEDSKGIRFIVNNILFCEVIWK